MYAGHRGLATEISEHCRENHTLAQNIGYSGSASPAQIWCRGALTIDLSACTCSCPLHDDGYLLVAEGSTGIRKFGISHTSNYYYSIR